MANPLIQKCIDYNFKRLFNSKGYAFFTKGNYNLNIIGVRHSGNQVTNRFDDALVLIYNTPELKERRAVYPITTDPGIKSMLGPVNRKGCAILAPGQYRGCWTIGKHRGAYSALVQCKPVKIFRDNDRDVVYDFDFKTIEDGVFGINIHKAGAHSELVDNWSAGCQVFQKDRDFLAFMRYCNAQVNEGLGNRFTYTLLTEDELV